MVKEVAFSFVDDTGIHACGIDIPQIPPHPCDRLAGDVADKMAFDDNWDTGLVLSYVFADEFAADVVRAVIATGAQEDVTPKKTTSMLSREIDEPLH